MANQIETHIEIQLENRNRKTAFFRLILSLPLFAFLYLFQQFSSGNEWSTIVLALPVAAALIVRNVYPSWLLSFNHAVLEFGTRIAAYVLLLTDEYPTFERNPKIAVIFPDVEGGKKLNRWLPLVKVVLGHTTLYCRIYLFAICFCFLDFGLGADVTIGNLSCMGW